MRIHISGLRNEYVSIVRRLPSRFLIRFRTLQPYITTHHCTGLYNVRLKPVPKFILTCVWITNTSHTYERMSKINACGEFLIPIVMNMVYHNYFVERLWSHSSKFSQPHWTRRLLPEFLKNARYVVAINNVQQSDLLSPVTNIEQAVPPSDKHRSVSYRSTLTGAGYRVIV